MNAGNLSPIYAEAVAAKLEQIANFQQPELLEEITEQPRLVELLWFLQFISHPDNYAGGLARFCSDFIGDAAAAAAVGTSGMVAVRADAQRFTFEQARAIYHELPQSAQRSLAPYPLSLLFDRNAYNKENGEDCRWLDGPEWCRSGKAKLLDEAFTPEVLRELCKAAAVKHLGCYFKRLCEQPNVTFRRHGSRDWNDNSPRSPWYFVNVADALLAFMDRRKVAIASRIAETEITKQVFEGMNFSQETARGVLLEGNTRFGKTEAIKSYCDMNPGLARLVNTPATNSLGDLLREVARALGIDSAPGRRGGDLRERIDYVLRFSKLLLCFDESNFLLPGSYSKSTAPARLNWVRRSVMDRKTPAVFVHTPQNNAPAKMRFVKVTGYEMAQFDERLFTITLPAELAEADLIAVARIHFPDLPELYLKHVVEKAQATERNYVSDIEKIATLANYKAKAAGRKQPVLDDINAAIANVLPAAKPLPAGPIAAPGALIAQPERNQSARPAAPLRKPRKGVAAPLHTSRITFPDSAERAENETEDLVAT